LRAIEQSFQQSYPQFLGTPSKDLEKQQLTCDFKNIYEQENDRMQIHPSKMNQHRKLNAKVV
jgi:hypothetical protein